MLPDVPDKSSDSDETIYVRHLIEEGLKKAKGMTDLARQLAAPNIETTRAYLTLVRSGDRGTGHETWQLFANAHHNGSLDEFRAAARMYVATRRPTVSRIVYPSREPTLEWMLNTNQATARAIEQVANMSLGPDVPDPGPEWWQQRVKELQRSLDEKKPPPPVLGTVPATGGADGTLIVMRRPLDWLGLRQLRDEILRDKALSPYHAAIWGFSEELTASDRPEPLTIETIKPLLDRFIARHPKDADPANWSYWRRSARKHMSTLHDEDARHAEAPSPPRASATVKKSTPPPPPEKPPGKTEGH